MLHKTRGIVLRPVKYGETSLVVTVFTEQYGVQTYMVKGVRVANVGRNRASYFQCGMLLDMVVYMQPAKNLQIIREFNAAYLYGSIHENVFKNSIALFSAELLLRLLPEHAPLPELYQFAHSYFIELDSRDLKSTANFPLYFMAQCSRLLGYEPIGEYTEETPHLNRQEGGFSAHTPVLAPYTTDDDAQALHQLLISVGYEQLAALTLTSEMRLRLIDWYIAYLHEHTQHMGNIRSLAVLRSVLH